MKRGICIFWFRRDLRLDDNTGLHAALSSGHKVLCTFFFDKNILAKLEDKEDARVLFIHQRLSLLNEELRKYGSSLLVLHTTPMEGWKKIVKENEVAAVYTNRDYEPYALERDNSIQEYLSTKGIKFNTYKDHVLFEKDEIVKEDGKPYTVFTPYKNKYLKSFSEFTIKTVPSKSLLENLLTIPILKVPGLKDIGFKEFDFPFPSGEVNREIVKKYKEQRDFPAVNGTSRLSMHIRFGTVSIRALAAIAVKEKSEIWLNELIWRDFYQMIIWHFPHVVQSSFKPAYDKIPWRNNEKDFAKWCEGKTGYPIVDAGMRELNATGFMHNRVRMVAASFLTKHLLIDWRWGEAYFAKKLLDYDLASNNGGWQWASGSGCDAAPYFRIFNPAEQTRKFDPELKYIRKWVPEFEDFSYPSPIVEHKFARERCLRVYKKALSVSE